MFTGVSCGMGEATFLGFLKAFPGDMVVYVSSGTGFAGISGTLTLLFFDTLGTPPQYVFLIVCPTILIYFLCFAWLNA
jgi:hypothetical protein